MNRKYQKISTFLKMAATLSFLSTCSRLKVGALITDQSFRVLSMGYNGRANGKRHCIHDPQTPLPGKCDCIHRQQNRIIFGGQYFNLQSKKIFITVSPCLTCRRMLNQFKVAEVYYLQEYRDATVFEYLKQNGIKCLKVNL